MTHQSKAIIHRRRFTTAVAATFAASCIKTSTASERPSPPIATFALRYMLASSMYGCLDLKDILPEVTRIGAAAIDLWPRKHGNQREQLDAMGEERFLATIADHGITVGCLTRYDLSPANRQDEMRSEIKLAGRLGCDTVVTSGRGPKNLKGSELKAAVKAFVEDQKPTIAIAEENGVRLAIENHANNLINSPDSLKYLAELTPSPSLAIALAPYHLPQDASKMGELIKSLGPAIALFYAWEHGMGCMKKLPKEQELMQMPGLGRFDFRPVLAALKSIHYQGWTEVFMHPVPRGIPIRETAPLVTQEINRSRSYLDNLLNEIEFNETQSTRHHR